MASIAYGLYETDGQRTDCYTCPDRGSGNVNVRGREMMLECRQFTQIGLETEVRLSVRTTDIFETGLIHMLPIGVDSAKMSFGKKFKFKTQSRGSGGLSKYQCGQDFQIPELIKHEKCAHTEMLYVHHEGCPKEYISTELQDMVYQLDQFQESYNPDNALSDMFLMAARETVTESVQYTDIIGIYGSANERSNSYDGILAQMYWAYTGNAYFNSVKYIIDEAVLTTGMYVHLKYSGLTLDIQFDDSQASDPDLERYATRMEVYERIVDWLNLEVLTVNGRKFVDATFNANNIIVTSKWGETTVNLQMFIDANETVSNWTACETFAGVTVDVLQNPMPIDERPVLIKYRTYTEDNVLHDLPRDIYYVMRDLDDTLLDAGQLWALYIDKTLLDKYKFAQQTKPANASSFDLSAWFADRIYTLDALSEHGGSGLWFISAWSATEANRNVAHLVDTVNAAAATSMQLLLTQNCRRMEFFYEQLHGVMVKDFRKMGGNLLCSRFADRLVEPYDKQIESIPCYNRKVRECFIDHGKYDNDCKLEALFEICDIYKNGALYALPDGLGGHNIETLEAGETLPNNALPVYEVKIADKTRGIPITLVDDAMYEYTVTTEDGLVFVLTAKDPVIQYVGTSAGTVFNISQKVTLPNMCEDTYDASEDYGKDFPFECRGECADIDIDLQGSFYYIDKYTMTAVAQDEWEDVQIVTDKGNIDLVGNDTVQKTADQINAWLTDNEFGGEATVDGLTINISSPDVVFQTIDGNPITRLIALTIVDNTNFEQADGFQTIEVFLKCQGAVDPVDPTFEEFPNAEEVPNCTGDGWNLKVNVTTKLGCTFEDLEIDVDEIPVGESNINFELTN